MSGSNKGTNTSPTCLDAVIVLLGPALSSATHMYAPCWLPTPSACRSELPEKLRRHGGGSCQLYCWLYVPARYDHRTPPRRQCVRLPPRRSHGAPTAATLSARIAPASLAAARPVCPASGPCALCHLPLQVTQNPQCRVRVTIVNLKKPDPKEGLRFVMDAVFMRPVGD